MAGHIGMNLVTLKDGRESSTLVRNLDIVSEAGFDGVGIWMPTIEGWLAGGHSVAELSQLLQDRGLEVHELCFVKMIDDEGKMQDARKQFAWAKELGAPVVVTIYGRPEDPMDQVRDNWVKFVRSVEDFGVSPAFEFIGVLERFDSPLKAWDVIKDGPELGTMVFDAFHFWRGGCDMSEFGQFPGDRVSLVHLDDAKNIAREGAKDTDRTYPGEGITQLGDILRSLDDNGFTGPYSLELFGEVQHHDPVKVAARCYETTRTLLDSLR